MTVKISKSILNVFGLIDIIYGVFEIIFSILAFADGGLLASGQVAAEEGVTGPMVILVGVVFLLLGAFSLVEGILSRRAAKDPSKAKPAFVFAIISLVLAAVGLVNTLTGSGSPVSAIVSVVINVLLVVAANTLRKEGNEDLAA